MRDRPGRPYDQLWVMDLSTEKSIHLAPDKPASTPLWSPDSRWLAFRNADGNNSGLWIAHPDASDTTLLATLASTNSPLPGMGKRFAWSADSKQIAFVSSTPAEPADNNNDSFSFDFGCFELFEGSGACFRGWRRNEKVPSISVPTREQDISPFEPRETRNSPQCSPPINRYPDLCTVTINSGRFGSFSSFCRKLATCTSTVRVKVPAS